MYRNQYGSVIDKAKIDLISARARRMGFRRQDIEDIQQQVSMALLGFKFDVSKSNGASERTAITAVIDRQLRKIRRFRSRHVDRLAGSENLPADIPDLEGQSYVRRVRRAADLNVALARLCPTARTICGYLGEGQSINEIASRMGVSWHTIRKHVDAIRQCFAELGLDELAV